MGAFMDQCLYVRHEAFYMMAMPRGRLYGCSSFFFLILLLYLLLVAIRFVHIYLTVGVQNSSWEKGVDANCTPSRVSEMGAFIDQSMYICHEAFNPPWTMAVSGGI